MYVGFGGSLARGLVELKELLFLLMGLEMRSVEHEELRMCLNRPRDGRLG